ncbi:MAG: hypothetical protein O7E52_25840 [Candidatus Poribacteria bacterium]|nr:hypothetical protein [Candidatus Poribacteria bacterium]
MSCRTCNQHLQFHFTEKVSMMSKELARYLPEHICLYASFDKTMAADFSRGDGAATCHPEVVSHDPAGGRYSGALVFNAKAHG